MAPARRAVPPSSEDSEWGRDGQWLTARAGEVVWGVLPLLCSLPLELLPSFPWEKGQTWGRRSEKKENEEDQRLAKGLGLRMVQVFSLTLLGGTPPPPHPQLDGLYRAKSSELHGSLGLTVVQMEKLRLREGKKKIYLRMPRSEQSPPGVGIR